MATSAGYAERGCLPALAVDRAIPSVRGKSAATMYSVHHSLRVIICFASQLNSLLFGSLRTIEDVGPKQPKRPHSAHSLTSTTSTPSPRSLYVRHSGQIGKIGAWRMSGHQYPSDNIRGGSISTTQYCTILQASLHQKKSLWLSH